MADNYLSRGTTRERIDPATEDKQRDIETLLKILTGDKSTIFQSTAGDAQKLVIASNIARGLNQECRSCIINVPSGNAGTIYLTLADRDAVVTDFEVPQDQATPIPIDNTNKLRFYGGTDGDVIHVLWRN